MVSVPSWMAARTGILPPSSPNSPSCSGPRFSALWLRKKETHLEEKSLAGIKSGARRATIKISITPENIASRQDEVTEIVTFGWGESD